MPRTYPSIMKDYVLEYRRFVPRNPDDWSIEEDLEGKIVIITGCNTGVGKATAIELAKRKAHIIMACRDLAKTQEAALDINNLVPNAKLDIIQLDLADLESVRKFAETVMQKYPHINILINNGGLSKPTGVVEKTKDGFELHMGVNHLGHFLLTLLLLDHLKKGAPSRVVIVASTAHLYGDIDLNDLMLESGKSWGYSNMLAYANSKLANMLFARELSKRLAGIGVTTYGLCPGVVQTDIGRDRQNFLQRWLTAVTHKLVGFTPAQGAQTVIMCATSKSWANESGRLYRFEKHWDGANEILDEELGLRLWHISEELVGLTSTRNSKLNSKLTNANVSAVFN